MGASLIYINFMSSVMQPDACRQSLFSLRSRWSRAGLRRDRLEGRHWVEHPHYPAISPIRGRPLEFHITCLSAASHRSNLPASSCCVRIGGVAETRSLARPLGSPPDTERRIAPSGPSCGRDRLPVGPVPTVALVATLLIIGRRHINPPRRMGREEGTISAQRHRPGS